jgi:hypothetical protein
MIATLFQVSSEQKDQLVAGQICDDWRFNPIQINGGWFISAEEISAASHEAFPFLSDLIPSAVALPGSLEPA